MHKNILGILILCVVTIWLYGFTLNHGFFQDDFYSLAQSQAHNFHDVAKWFTPGNEIYYRPISMRVYFWLMNTVFGPNPFPYHVFALILHLINSYLVVKIAARLSYQKTVGWLTGLLYATSSIHFVSLMWIAEIGLIMGITIYLFAIWTYLRHDRSQSLFTMTGLYTFGLLVHEYIITLPATLLLLELYQRQFTRVFPTLSISLKKLWPLFLIAIIYLILRLVAFPLHATGTYDLISGKPTIRAAFWYGVWSLNIPENLIDQLEPGLKLNQTFLYDFPSLSLTSIITLIVIFIVLVAIPLASYLEKTSSNRRILNHHLLFYCCWVAITLSIPLITPLHLYPIYASLALVGIGYIFSELIQFAYHHPNLISSIVLVGWIITAWQSIRFMEKVHWTVQESDRVKSAHQKLLASYGKIPPESTILINQDYQIEQALYGDLGFQILFNDPSITTHYGSVATILPQECTMEPSNTDCLVRYRIYPLPQ